jgi:hypothetical protein
MKTLLEHLDDLDRMIEAGNTPTDKLRSQLAFIGREIAALQTDYASLHDAHAELHAGLEERISKLQEKDKRELRQWFDEQAKKNAALRKSYTLER